jgi:hypothetical protein
MASDVILNDGENQDWVSIDGAVLHSSAADLLIDAPERRSQSGGLRRALVHDHRDGLTLNYNGDYPGGVTIQEVNQLEFKPRAVGSTLELPAEAEPGTLMLVEQTSSINGQLLSDDMSLWLCIPASTTSLQRGRARARWQRVQLGEIVDGTS